MRRNLLSLALLLLAGLGLAHGQTPSYDFSAVSPSGDTLYYKIISYYDATVSVCHPSIDSIGGSISIDWTGYTRPTDSLIIPSSVNYEGTNFAVTSIESHAFTYCDSLDSVVIPNSVTSIGSWAFSECRRLASVVIPNSVTSIGSFAFYNCTSLDSVTIPSSVTSIGDDAFYGVMLIVYYGSATDIGLWGAIHMTDIYDFSAVSPSGDTLYYKIHGSGSTVYVRAPIGTIDYYGNYVNMDWTGYTPPTDSLIIPSSVNYGGINYSVTGISGHTFEQCVGLTSVTIPNSVTSIGAYAFSGCTSLASVTIPNSVTSIEWYAFGDCTSLASVTIPNSVTWISDGAFRDCISLASVTIPNSVTSIGSDAFSGCTNLASVTIPNSVTWISDGAFGLVRHIEYYGTATGSPWGALSMNGFVDGDFVYADSTRTSLLAYIGSSSVVNIPNSVTSIGTRTFYYCTSLASVTIPNSVTSIGSYAFSGCTNLASVTIPNSVTSIEWYAFSGCTSLASVTIPNSVTWISNGAFNLVRHIEYYGTATGSPWGALSMNGFVDGDFVYADSTRTSLLAYIGSSSVVNIPNSVTSIGTRAFYGYTSLASVTIPTSVTSISSQAFDGCSNLASVYYNAIQANATSYDGYSFGSCTSITSFIFGDSVSYIPSSLCRHLTHLTSVSIPNSVTSIGNSAFYGCTSLTSVTIPNSVTYIGSSAFEYCTSLASVTIPNSVTSIRSDTFCGCSSLSSITILCTAPPSVGYRAFWGVPTNVRVWVPCNSIVTYTSPSHWCDFSNIAELSDCGGHYWDFYTGLYGRHVYYKILDDSASVAVVHPLAADTIDGTYWHGYSRTSGSLVIPKRVNHGGVSYVVRVIGNQAFKGCTGLTSVTIPASVDSIGNSAFANCYNLRTVNFNADSCRYMGEVNSLVFQNDRNFTTLHIGANVKNIPDYAFELCTGLTAIHIPDSVVNIGAWSFAYNANVTDLTIGQSVDYIGNSAFANCYNLHAVSFNADSCRHMGEANSLVFQNDHNFTTLHIGANVKNIPDYAFELCTGLTAIHIPDSVVNIGAWSFAYDANVTDLTIGQSVDYIGEYAFYGCGRLQHVVVPQNVTHGSGSSSGGGSSWGGGVFGGCSFGSISYGGSIISSNMFAGNTELNTVFISDTDTIIGDSAFFNCTSLISVSPTGIPELWIPRPVCLVGNAAYGNCIAATRVRYEADSCLRMGSDTVPVFLNDSNITTLIIGEHVRWIPDYAFYGCTGVDTITSNSMVAPALGADVFRDVPSTAVVNIPCGSLASYMARWPHFSNFVEMPFTDVIAVSTSDSTMGTANVTTMPSCGNGGMAVIEASANEGFRFVCWNDSVTDNPRTVTVSSDTTLTALFDTLYVTLTLTANNPDWGTMEGGGEYAYNTEVTVSATANEGFRFVCWNDSVTDNPRTVTVSSDTTLTALFDTLYVTLTLTANNPDWGSVEGGGEYAFNTEVTVSATANEGFQFTCWSDGSEENPRTIVVTADLELMANFAEQNGIAGATESNVKIYPNPTDGVLLIEADNVLSIEVCSMDGRVLLRDKQTNGIDLSSLSTGIYFVIVECPQGRSVHKVVKR